MSETKTNSIDDINYEKVREYISDFIQTTSDFEIGSFMPEFIKYSLDSIKSTHAEMLMILQSFIIDERQTIQIIEYEKLSLSTKLNDAKLELIRIEKQVEENKSKIQQLIVGRDEDKIKFQDSIECKEKELNETKNVLQQTRLDYYQIIQKVKDLENELMIKTQKINTLSSELQIYQSFAKKSKCVLL
jgi:chromosome segregation ATPase